EGGDTQAHARRGRSPRSRRSRCPRPGVTRCERCASYAATTPKTPTYSFPSAAGGFHRLIQRVGEASCLRVAWCLTAAADKFFPKEVAQNRPPHFPARTSSPPEIVSDQISGDGAWMNFRFSRALPPGGLAHARPDDLEAFPSGLGHAASGTTYLPTR